MLDWLKRTWRRLVIRFVTAELDTFDDEIDYLMRLKHTGAYKNGWPGDYRELLEDITDLINKRERVADQLAELRRT